MTYRRSGIGQIPPTRIGPPGTFVDQRSAYDRFMADHGYSVVIYGSLAAAVGLGVAGTWFTMRRRVKANRRRRSR